MKPLTACREGAVRRRVRRPAFDLFPEKGRMPPASDRRYSTADTLWRGV